MNFYFIALLPLIAGGIIWIFNKKVNWVEWVCGSAAAFILAGIFHFIAIRGMTDDTETWSGQITQAKQFSRWHEAYQEAIYRTEYYTEKETYYTNDSKGNRHSHTRTVQKSRRVFDHWEDRTRWHNAHWECYSDLNTSYDIADTKYWYFTNKFKMDKAIAGSRTTWEHNSHMIGGDPNDYTCGPEITHWIEPITIHKSFVNKIRACPSVFSFITVPTNIPVYNWPSNPNPFVSDRVLGTARKYISTLEWDKLNSYLGGRKKINLIIVGFDSDDSMLGQYQRAKWVGGKKNDLVITLGGKDLTKPNWCYVFGWTDSDYSKQNIQSYIMENGLTTNLFGFITQDIIQNYKIKDWKQFDYLRIEPAVRYYYWYAVILLLTQVGLYIWFSHNEWDKQEPFVPKPLTNDLRSNPIQTYGFRHNDAKKFKRKKY